jgi:hypothetical protein
MIAVQNPFWVSSPEQVDADYIARNFVAVFTDHPQLFAPTNTFILGARGTGKSMLLRSLEPEVMVKRTECTLKTLPYVGVHVPLRQAEFAVPELTRLKGYARYAIGEHLLTMHAMFRIASLLCRLASEISEQEAAEFAEYFFVLFGASGGGISPPRTTREAPAQAALRHVGEVCEQEIRKVRQFYTRQPFDGEPEPYQGALTGFLDLLVPMTRELRRLGSFGDAPIFLMLDDADNLPGHMQRILNSWVSSRSTDAVCLKITTQLGYKTYLTMDSRIIESPHDYHEINLTSIYTSNSEVYSKRVRQIIQKRLENAGIETAPDAFFPIDEAQAKRLEQIKDEIRLERSQDGEQSARGGSSRPRDDVTRYAVPRLMRELAGSAKSSHTFSYAGFQSMVDLSSGVLRWFLEPANRMYDAVASQQSSPVLNIPVSIQDRILLTWSQEFFEQLARTRVQQGDVVESDDEDDDASLHALGHETDRDDRLKNLIDGLGRLFRSRVLDADASEQRVFSIMLNGRPRRELNEVLDLGVRRGYFQRADNAAKEAFGGRRLRYIMARRLGPYFKLDISGYAAHLSILPEDLEVSMRSPEAFVATRRKVDGTDGRQTALGLDRSADD